MKHPVEQKAHTLNYVESLDINKFKYSSLLFNSFILLLFYYYALIHRVYISTFKHVR